MKRVFKVTYYKTHTEATWFKKTKQKPAGGYTEQASVQRHLPSLWLLTSGLAGLSSKKKKKKSILQRQHILPDVLSLRSYGQTLTAAFQTNVGLPSSATRDKGARADIYFRKCWEKRSS